MLSQNNNIKKLANIYDLGEIKEIIKLKSSQNEVYKIITNKNTYVIKEYTKDAIKNYYYLNKRKKQIKISKIFKNNNINTVIPISHNKKDFIYFKKHYYLIYNFYNEKNKSYEEIDIEEIKILANTQAKIHKLNIQENLPCIYKNINIDLNKIINKSKKINKELYQKLKTNELKLNKIIHNCNQSIKNIKKNLCISHNDYKLLNILWNQKEIILIDFDATGMSNPTASLCESAFSFSYNKKEINYDFYKNYLKSYIQQYGNIKEDFYESMYASFNGKLQWLTYMLDKNHFKKNNYIKETIEMINELITYYDNLEIFNNIYKEINYKNSI